MIIKTSMGSFSLDSDEGEHVFLSHAHSDHAGKIRNVKSIIASKETLALARINAEIKEMKSVTLEEAGHILGSKQLVLEADGKKIVYTGDIRLRDSILFKGAKIVECDHLIIEATYGDPSYKFPHIYDIIDSIKRWLDKNQSSNILIGGYALGKAQELIKILNSFGISPVVDKNIEFYNKVYESFGIKLDRIVVGSSEAEEALSHPFVAVVEKRRAKRYFAKKLEAAFGRKTLVAIATGWALNFKFNVDASFPLSDHSDFYELVEYIELSNAKKIEFFHGSGEKILNYIKNKKAIQTKLLL